MGGGDAIDCMVGGVRVTMLIDSGCLSNVIDKNCWEMLRLRNAQYEDFQSTVDRTFTAFGSTDPIPTLGSFVAKLVVDETELRAKFYIVDIVAGNLLGLNSAKALGVLRTGKEKVPELLFLPKIKGVVAEIPLDKSATPVALPPRKVPLALQESVKARLDELLRRDVIEEAPEFSRWQSPLVVAYKRSGDVRICVDVSKLNKYVQRQPLPYPSFEDLSAEFYGATLFSKLDIEDAFHQIELDIDCRELTTFSTHAGTFRYKRLLFGLANAPELFQRVITYILRGLKGVKAYLDDLIVYGASKQEHDQRLKAVLERLEQFGVRLNMAKCEFGRSRIAFLGHEVSADGIQPSRSKIEALERCEPPQSKEEVQSFLGTVAYLGHRFIPNLSELTAPMRRLTQKGVFFSWGEEEQASFSALKNELSRATVLSFFSATDKTRLYTDASPYGLGAVLIQVGPDGVPRPIAFGSKALSGPDQALSQTEREAAAIVHFVEHFDYYLRGRQFELMTDHKALEVIFGRKKDRWSITSARIERWRLRLQEYQFEIFHVPGKHMIADFFSRRCQTFASNEADVDETVSEVLHALTRQLCHGAISEGKLQEESSNDKILVQLRSALAVGNWDPNLVDFKRVQDELCVIGNVVLRGERIIIPESLREPVLSIAHEGHPGMSLMKRRLRSKYWWPGMDGQVEACVNRCVQCKLVATSLPAEPLKRTEMPMEPWEYVGVDFLGPLPGGEKLMLVVDYYSRYFEVEVMV